MMSQTICDGYVSDCSGGNAGLLPPGAAVCAFVAIVDSSGKAAISRRLVAFASDAVKQQKRDGEREDAHRLSHGEPEDQVAELALRGRRITQRRGEVMAE